MSGKELKRVERVGKSRKELKKSGKELKKRWKRVGKSRKELERVRKG